MLVPYGAFVLVVDGGRAQILRNRGRDIAPSFELLHERHLRNPRNHSLASDGPGRHFESVGPHRGSYPVTDRHQRREDEFGEDSFDLACELAGESSPLIVIAPPHMLGQLRDHYRRHPQCKIAAEINKDLADRSPTEIAEFLANWQSQ